MQESRAASRCPHSPSNVTISSSIVLFVQPDSGSVYPAICFAGKDSSNYINFQARENSAQFLGPGSFIIPTLHLQCTNLLTSEYHTCRHQQENTPSQTSTAPPPGPMEISSPNDKKGSPNELCDDSGSHWSVIDGMGPFSVIHHDQNVAQKLGKASRQIDEWEGLATAQGSQANPRGRWLTVDDMTWGGERNLPRKRVYPISSLSKVDALLLEAHMYQEDMKLLVNPLDFTREWVFSAGELCLCEAFQRRLCRHADKFTRNMYRRYS